MCPPKFPSADAYDNNYQVEPHFSKTPGLTLLPPDHRYNYEHIPERVKSDLREIYIKHHFKRCSHYGLYYAGSKKWTGVHERAKTMLLVVELTARDIKNWHKIDAEVREILKNPDYGLDGEHGICVRYYEYWKQPGDELAREIQYELHRHEALQARNRRLLDPPRTVLTTMPSPGSRIFPQRVSREEFEEFLRPFLRRYQPHPDPRLQQLLPPAPSMVPNFVREDSVFASSPEPALRHLPTTPNLLAQGHRFGLRQGLTASGPGRQTGRRQDREHRGPLHADRTEESRFDLGRIIRPDTLPERYISSMSFFRRGRTRLED